MAVPIEASEVRQIASGAMVCDLGLAVTEIYKNGSGENVETTCFVDVVTWCKQYRSN